MRRGGRRRPCLLQLCASRRDGTRPGRPRRGGCTLLRGTQAAAGATYKCFSWCPGFSTYKPFTAASSSRPTITPRRVRESGPASRGALHGSMQRLPEQKTTGTRLSCKRGRRLFVPVWDAAAPLVLSPTGSPKPTRPCFPDGGTAQALRVPPVAPCPQGAQQTLAILFEVRKRPHQDE